MGWILILAVVVILGGAILLVVLGIQGSGEMDPLESRLAEFAASGEAVTLEEIEMSQPLAERIFFPMARR
ncbi:MAG: hypothetical protein P8Y03_28500, partial [Anaerolineales bacterium]